MFTELPDLSGKSPVHVLNSKKTKLPISKVSIRPSKFKVITVDDANKIKHDVMSIVNNYDKLTTNEMEDVDVILFSEYLVQLYQKDNKAKDSVTQIIEISHPYLKDSLKKLKSKNVKNKIIGIDMFMSVCHSNPFIIDLVLSNLKYLYLTSTDLADDINLVIIDIELEVIRRLNEIRNRKGLSQIVDNGHQCYGTPEEVAKYW